MHTSSLKEEGKFRARSTIHECEWRPRTSSAGSRRTDVPCVVQQGWGQTHPDGCFAMARNCQTWPCSPSLPQGSAIAKTSTNTFLQPTWSTALGAAWLNAEAEATSRGCFCTALLSVDPGLKKFVLYHSPERSHCFSCHKDSSQSWRWGDAPDMLMQSEIFNNCLTTLMNSTS